MKNKIIIGLVCLGLLLIGFSLVSPEKSFDLFSNTSLAKITDIQSEQDTGVKTHGLDQYEETIAKVGMKLRHLDILKTVQESEALLELLNSKGQIRLLENSEILIEKSEDENILITVRFGDIIVEKFGSSPSFWTKICFPMPTKISVNSATTCSPPLVVISATGTVRPAR